MQRLLAFAAGVSVVSVAACSDSPSAPSETLLEQVRAEVSVFSSPESAAAAGYVEDPHCVAHPELGGMGFHWINEELIDPVFDPLQPEGLLYGPTADGGRELLGVEYIVIDVGQDHPQFDGHPFDVGGVPPLEEVEVAHWSLHVWTHEENPSGDFMPFNPNVSCD